MKIELNDQQLQILSAAIIELPYRVSAPLIAHINQQIQEQRESEVNDKQEKSEI
jgi:hypothetical protein